MHSRVAYNGELFKAGEPRLPLATPATLFGRGVFTTIAVHNTAPFRWDRHWARLTAHAARIGVDLTGIEPEAILKTLDQLLKANKVRDGRARISILAQGGNGMWSRPPASAQRSDILLMTADARPSSDEGLAITVSPFRINTHSPLVGIKSLNYLEPVLSLEEAQGRDFAEAVRLNERGVVVSCTMANIFWAANGTVYTPALAAGALAGTTREAVIELAREMSIPLIEGMYELSAVTDADEIFITSAGRGVSLVTTFDFHRYTVAFGSIGLRLHEAWRQLIVG